MTGEVKLCPAVFIDRDGTLNKVVYDSEGMENSPFRVEDLELLPGAAEFTRRIREAGYLAVLVTNQPGVAKGSITIDGLNQIHQRLCSLLEEDGGGLDRICYCPHHPKGKPGISSPFIQACDCRKPGPGMLTTAAEEMGINLARSWMVGDKLLDVQAGQAAGCRTILLPRVTGEHDAIPKQLPQAAYEVNSLGEAFTVIRNNGT